MEESNKRKITEEDDGEDIGPEPPKKDSKPQKEKGLLRLWFLVIYFQHFFCENQNIMKLLHALLDSH